MKIAIPLFESDVAPRFGFADRFLIGEITEKRVVDAKEVAITAHGWNSRLEVIRDLGVEVLLCGGFNRTFLPLAEKLGIDVVTGQGGEGAVLLEAFALGKVRPSQRGRGKRRHRAATTTFSPKS